MSRVLGIYNFGLKVKVTKIFSFFAGYYMPRARSQYIAEMRERFEVVDRVKASAEEKASLTKAIHQEDSDPSSVENTPSKVEFVTR